jgi:hypothetical protein
MWNPTTKELVIWTVVLALALLALRKLASWLENKF